MDTDTEARARLAYALNAAMAQKGWRPPDLARAIGRDASTVTRWANGESVPNMLMTKPLAEALSVKPEFLFDPPPIPDYPLADYLVLDAAESGVKEGLRRARSAPGEPALSPERHPRASGAGHE